MIGVDWGSTNIRAFRFGADGGVIESRHAAQGIAVVPRDRVEMVLTDLIGDWLADDRDILLAGMVGSRTGWLETGYAACPIDPATLARQLIAVPTPLGRCRIVPGIAWRPADAPGEVMRGEETQLLGSGIRDGCALLPGTHSKWAWIEGGRITRFRTALTGELFALLLQHSMLGQVATAGDAGDGAAFRRGVGVSLRDPALILTLFSARAAVLLGDLAPGDVSAYLSGMLIGAEIAAMPRPLGPLTIIGGQALADRYRVALSLAGIEEVTTIDGDAAAARGLWAIGIASR